MFGARIRDHGHCRPDEADEFGHIADAIGAHLDDGTLVRSVEPHQCQRHADVIVEVAARRQAGAGAAQDRGNHFLGGGLAVAAGDRHHG